MTSSGTNRCRIVLVLVLLGSVVWAQEPNEIPVRLEFELSSTPLGPYSAFPSGPRSALRGGFVRWFRGHKPTYAAGILLVGARNFLPFPSATSPSMADFLSYAEQRAGLSEQQKKFLKDAWVAFQHGNNMMYGSPEPNAPPHLMLYAVTLEDAQKMAQAFFQHGMALFRMRVDEQEGGIREVTEKIARAERKIAEVDSVTETTSKLLADFQKNVPYRTESEAQEAIGELDRMLNAAQVEIAGIKAKMQTIMTHQRESSSRRMSQDVINRLQIMYMEESIVLQGTEARRQRATHLRDQANRFLDLKSTLAGAAGEKKALAESLRADQVLLRERQERLEAVQHQEPEIPEKVLIYPVEWIDRPVEN
jgi:hypothetical protein